MQEKCIYCVLFIVSVQWQSLALAFYSLFTVLTVSIPHKQTVFPQKLMESNANLFGKLIPLHSLPVWFQFTTDTNRTATVVLYAL